MPIFAVGNSKTFDTLEVALYRVTAYHEKRRITAAKLLQAVVAYGPKIDLMEAAQAQRFMELITRHTTLSAGVFKNVQESEMETLIDLLREGRPAEKRLLQPALRYQDKHISQPEEMQSFRE